MHDESGEDDQPTKDGPKSILATVDNDARERAGDQGPDGASAFLAKIIGDMEASREKVQLVYDSTVEAMDTTLKQVGISECSEPSCQHTHDAGEVESRISALHLAQQNALSDLKKAIGIMDKKIDEAKQKHRKLLEMVNKPQE